MCDLLAPGEPAVPGVGEVLPALAEVVAVVLAQAAEPAGPRELGRLVLQGVEVPGGGGYRKLAELNGGFWLV